MLRAPPKRKASRSAVGSGASSSEWTAPVVASREPSPPVPFAALGITAVALLVAAFATSAATVLAAASLVVVAAALGLLGPVPRRSDAGVLALVLAPLGAMLSVLAAWAAFADGADPRLLLVGGALGAASGILRAWIDASAARPLERLLDSLRARMPSRAHVPVDDAARPMQLGSQSVEVERLRVGEEVLVLEGEYVPVDGVVRAGEASMLLHPAARAPARRRAGDPVLAGARLVDGAVRVLATRVGADRALLRPLRFGDGHADDAARITRAVARGLRFAGLAIALGGGLAAWLGEAGGGLAMRLSAAAGVLLAVPLLALRRAAEGPFVAAGATAAERGISFQSARALDRAGTVDVVALCTHGTITEGEPEVVEIHGSGDEPPERALALAAAAEAAAPPHPVGRAIVRHAERRGIPLAVVRRVTAIPGRGVTAVGSEGESIVVGNRALLLDEGTSVAALDAEAARAERRGQTVVFVGIDRRLRALVCLRDEERPGARAAVQRLIDLDVEVLLVSGDHRASIEALARALDVDHVKAELLPEERGDEVRRLRERGSVAAAVGRTPDDDALLAAADVPIVLGAAGAPEGDRAVALTSDDVRDASAALWLAFAARREATRAVAVAAAAGAVLAALATTGTAGPAAIALGAMAIDAFAIPAAARLLRRVELRLPSRG